MPNVIHGKTIATEDIKSSSSNNVYTVTLYDNCISCTCPAGGRKSFCKHMVSMLYENIELLKNEHKQFYKDVRLLLELKNNKNHDIEKYKNLCNKVIFVNRNIAEKAHNNAAILKEESSTELAYIIELIENNFSQEEKLILLKILEIVRPHIFKTMMYLKRSLGIKITESFYGLLPNKFIDTERDYSAGGQIVDELLEKYHPEIQK